MLLQASDWKSLNWQEPEEDHASISYGGGDMTPTIKVPSSRGLVSECYRLGLSEPATNNSRQIFPSLPSAIPSSYNFTPTSQRPRPPAPPTSSLLAEVINYLIYSDSGGFLFIARYKTGIAALSITWRRGSGMSLEAIGSIRTAARGIVLNYNFVVTFCILPAPLAGRRGGAQPSRNGSAPHSVPLHSNLSKKESTLPHNS